jgi:hypothetical protein
MAEKMTERVTAPYSTPIIIGRVIFYKWAGLREFSPTILPNESILTEQSHAVYAEWLCTCLCLGLTLWGGEGRQA